MKRKLLRLASLMLVFSGLLGILQTQPASANWGPTPPSFVDPTCDNNMGSYTIPNNDWRRYKVGGAYVDADTYLVSEGSTVTIQEYIYSWTWPYGWVASGSSWSHTFTIQESCIEEVTPAEVTFVDPTCEVAGSYTIPEQTGVAYQVDGATVPAGTYSAEAGESVTVTAAALEGFSLIGTTEWSHPFVIEGECEEDQAIINYDVVCGRDGATVTFTNTGNVNGEVTLNGEVITVEAGATVERLVETGKDGQRITIVVGDETVYDELVDCDKGEVLGGSTVRPTALPNTSGDLGMATIALLTLAGAALSGLSFAARKLAVRAI